MAEGSEHDYRSLHQRHISLDFLSQHRAVYLRHLKIHDGQMKRIARFMRLMQGLERRFARGDGGGTHSPTGYLLEQHTPIDFVVIDD